MKRFKFNLEKLLEIRQKKEELQKANLAKASGAYQAELNKVEKIKNNVKEYKKYYIGEKKNLTVENLRFIENIVNNASKAIENLKPVIEEKKAKMEKELELYNQLRRDKRVVEILKEKSYKKYLEEAGREEQKNIDEIAKDTYIKSKANKITSEN
ncbi:MAG: flagellar export protein FliJ [Brevinematia bacterium]